MSSGSADTNGAGRQAAEQPAAVGGPPGRDVAAAAASAGNRLIDRLVTGTAQPATGAADLLSRFLGERSPARALRLWLGPQGDIGRAAIIRRLNRDVALIDQLVNQQLNAVLHVPKFQRLEAAWRGLDYLIDRADLEGATNIKIRVLSLSKRQLAKDLDAAEFDQSQMFRKIYENEFGMPGGEPFGVVIGDYEFGNHPQEMSMLTRLASVAAAACCPFIASASPTLFGIDDFRRLEQRLNHAKTFQQQEYLKWRALRATDDARFVGLTLPRVLMRRPYEDDGTRVDRFCFEEDISGPDARDYLWGSAAYAFGGVLIRAFAASNWFADIRGVRRGIEGGGLVNGLPVHDFSTDAAGVAPKCSTDVIVTDELEKELSDLGFIPLCHCKDTPYSAFYAAPSVQQPKQYDRSAATTNAKISAMLHHMLCVSRFAHYIKVLGREKVGLFSEPERLEQYLSQWIVQYVTPDSAAAPETKARFPLRDAKVRVVRRPDAPGHYECILHMAPHFELDELKANVRLTTRLAPQRVP